MSTETLIKHHHDAHAEHGHHDAGANKVFGFWIYLMSDCIIFALPVARQVKISLSCRLFW
ncbi:MAG: cyoC [Pantoea agglomerans]|nr:cyoC [Pantoea agglomerans]